MAIVTMVLETEQWRYRIEEELGAVTTLRVEDLDCPQDDAALFGWVRIWTWQYEALQHREVFGLLQKVQQELERTKDYYYAYAELKGGKITFKEMDG